MKMSNEPITVNQSSAGDITGFVWQRQRYRVLSVEDTWRKCGKWWVDGVGFRRNYARVTVELVGRRAPRNGIWRHNSLTVDIFQQGSSWVLSRICD